jgi:hypothetical protein
VATIHDMGRLKYLNRCREFVILEPHESINDELSKLSPKIKYPMCLATAQKPRHYQRPSSKSQDRHIRRKNTQPAACKQGSKVVFAAQIWRQTCINAEGALGFLQAVIGRFGAIWGGGTSETDFCGSRLKMTDRNEEGRRVLGIRVTMTLAPFRMQEDLCKGVSFCWSPTAWPAEVMCITCWRYIYLHNCAVLSCRYVRLRTIAI